MVPDAVENEDSLDLLRDTLLQLHDVRKATLAMSGFLERSGAMLTEAVLRRVLDRVTQAADAYSGELKIIWDGLDLVEGQAEPDRPSPEKGPTP
jgi:hypothetical protein